MSEQICCSFCESLTAAAEPGWGGHSSKCPLCRQPLWAGPDGTTYRLDPNLPAPSRARAWLIGIGVVACMAAIAWLGPMALQHGWKQDPRTAIALAAPSVPDALNQEVVAANAPAAESKPGDQPTAAIAKPAAPSTLAPTPAVAAAPSRPVVAASAPIAGNPSPAAKAHRETYVPSRPTYYTSAEMVESLLRSVPEVDLDADYLKRTKAQISDRVKEIVAVNKDEKDAFIRDLMKKRTDLAGLPFLMGQDCSLAKDQAKQLALRSLEVRTALGELGRSRPRTSQSSDRPSYLGSYADVFWADLTERRWTSPEGVRALQQILGAENSDFRLGLMEHLKQSKEAHATEALIRHAVFDLDPNVRSSALAVLRERPAGEVRPALLKSLRYPWAPIAQNAAQAIVTLELKETIPDLIALLDAADPDAPFGVIEDGKAKTMVRELVRINHHRNCMLCHAPLEVTKANLVESRDLPVGPIPSGSEPLPPSSSPVYYTPRSGSSLVRADVTYLRQDFSLPMKVENSGKWSPMQRYDFLVRTRAASELEMGQQRPAVSAFKVAVVDALIGLTGKHAAPAAQAWRDALAEPPIAPKVKATR